MHNISDKGNIFKLKNVPFFSYSSAIVVVLRAVQFLKKRNIIIMNSYNGALFFSTSGVYKTLQKINETQICDIFEMRNERYTSVQDKLYKIITSINMS